MKQLGLTLALLALSGTAQASVFSRWFGRGERREAVANKPVELDVRAEREGVRVSERVALAPRKGRSPVKRQDLGEGGLRYQIGTGTPEGTLVFLHGMGGEPGDLFDDLAKSLGRTGSSFTAVSPWLRTPGKASSMTEQLDRARAAIAAQPGNVILVGHSFGGKAALQLAKEFPGKVIGVVGLAPSVKMAYSFWKGLTGERVLPDPATLKAALSARTVKVRAELAHLDADSEDDAAHALRRELSELKFQSDLAGYDEPALETHLAGPTLVFHGTEDSAVSIHYARRFAEANADTVRFVELPGEGHGFSDSLPQISNQLVAFAHERFTAADSPGDVR